MNHLAVDPSPRRGSSELLRVQASRRWRGWDALDEWEEHGERASACPLTSVVAAVDVRTGSAPETRPLQQELRWVVGSCNPAYALKSDRFIENDRRPVGPGLSPGQRRETRELRR